MLKPELVTIQEYYCDRCGGYVGPSGNALVFHDEAGNDFCLDCGLKQGIVDPITWLNLHGIDIYDHAFFDKANGKVTAFQKWGRGFRKDVLDVGPGESEGGAR